LDFYKFQNTLIEHQFLPGKRSMISFKIKSTHAPQIGVLLPVGNRNYIDAGVRYESNTKFYTDGNSNNFFAIRVAYASDSK